MTPIRYIGDNNMEGQPAPFAPLSLRPHWGQLVINQMMYILLAAGLMIGYVCLNFMFKDILLYLGMFVTLYLVYQVIYLARMEYVLTADQLIFLHGVVSHATDYMELYRVIDYRQHQTLAQQLAGLKTVTIYSGDHNTPIMEIIGIKEYVDVVKEIRKRVEYNKQIKHIYEITNRP